MVSAAHNEPPKTFNSSVVDLKFLSYCRKFAKELQIQKPH
jgi:hypothetical protein